MHPQDAGEGWGGASALRLLPPSHPSPASGGRSVVARFADRIHADAAIDSVPKLVGHPCWSRAATRSRRTQLPRLSFQISSASSTSSAVQDFRLSAVST
jgi:hypothetical protein